MTKIEEIIEAFQDADYQETLAMLLDYSENLAPLPEKYIEARDAGFNRVPECETPVFVWIDLNDGLVQIHADVPEESPTVRGFVGILVDSFNGTTPEEVQSAPQNLVHSLGLDQKLGTRRMFGLSAVYNRIKSGVKEASGLQ
ncbi:MAG: SufE family protein [Candidatus Dadabacteria bacterium]|jgi:cysteine desulfuration protein SufE|nr:SufE family protein [Candidatus Dadabacteria bacterium]MCZ6528378.1 SufE family protein [Candidatus Dadabacteria bacterium]MCZ6555734.1 SufE family protein [Candidatus Dadabacteria bacterium]MCZ6638485.1 SufE family protein [Candidatus Dadabacteria bacterium]MCZ6685540.1 SufE family protein [Candidatus Dadabacteria bacterium]